MGSQFTAAGRRSTVRTRHWSSLADGRTRCDLCPRACKLQDGQRGLCFVRACQDGEVVLTTFGRSSGFCIDPIEKKPLYHFLPGSPVLSFGTAGCNLSCTFCQNWDLSTSRDADTAAEYASSEMIVDAALRTGARSVAMTYNDPVVFMEYAMDVAEACRARGVKTVAVTAGYISPQPRRELFEHIDAANVDLKAFSDDFYRRYAKGQLQPVLDTLVYLKHETDVWLEITTLLIPGLNDDEAEIEALARWVVESLGQDVPIHFSAFHPDHKMRDRPRTGLATLTRARQIALRAGVRYAYTGNVQDPEGSSTYCHECGETLVERDGYEVGAWRLKANGACRCCGEPVAGLFEDAPGTWGSRRLPVRMSP